MKTIHIVEYFTDRDNHTFHELDYIKSQDHIREGLKALGRGAYGYVKVWTYVVPEGLNDPDIETLVSVLEENDFKGAELVYHIEIDAE